MQHGESAHRKADAVRRVHSGRVENRDRVLDRTALRVGRLFRGHVRRWIATGRVRDALMTSRQVHDLRLPASMVAGELVDEQDRNARTGDFVVQLDSVRAASLRHEPSVEAPMMWGMAQPRSWEAWSRAAWRRHLPDVADPDAFVAAIGHGTIHGLAHATAHATPDRPAIRIGGGEVTHGQLDSRAARFARWVGNQIAPGDRVLIAAPLGVDWVACYLGTLRVGGVAVLVNPAYTRAELDQLVVAAQPVEILTQLDESMFAADPAPWVESAGPDTTAVLAFTSGTTGLPKGVPLTHRQLLTSIRSAMSAWRWRARDVLVHALPLYHQHGLGGLHATLVAGSTLALLDRFDVDELNDEVEWGNATVLFAVPTMYQRLAGAPVWQNRLRLCISGSAPFSAEAASEARRVLGRQPLVRYGLTESGLNVSQVYGEPHTGTVGIPLPGVVVRLADDGEIQMRGPQVFRGYLGGRPGFTEAGWVRTGDPG